MRVVLLNEMLFSFMSCIIILPIRNDFHVLKNPISFKLANVCFKVPLKFSKITFGHDQILKKLKIDFSLTTNNIQRSSRSLNTIVLFVERRLKI